MQKYWLFLLLLTLTFCAFSQTDTTEYALKIYYGQDNKIQFCSDSVQVAPDIQIEGDGFNEDNEGVRISIANYKSGEDLLVYRGDNKFEWNWNNTYGYLEINGIGTTEEYKNAVKQVYYKNLKEVPTLGKRFISITLNDADYLPYTQHFYKFIKAPYISWTDARDSAATITYNGLTGYLATITSYRENDFISLKLDGIGWLGGTDEEVEGDWRWVTGPEAGTLFWRGAKNGVSINNEYSNWANNEPNNAGGEHYAHIYKNPDKEDRTWNDKENEGHGPNSQYPVEGFVAEFGGFVDDPKFQLSASTEIDISKVAYSNLRESTICEGESVTLNNITLPSTNSSVYSWSPNQEINDINIPNPLVSPTSTTVYSVIGKQGNCETSVDFEVIVNPIPIHSWDSVNIFCEGASIELDPGEHTSYLWENLDTTQTRIVSGEDFYSV
ncbi:MAG: hypothetical protein GQ525_13000, partial [Draconibacterium sp.]|nr:hypothetical protein [Draconibacterium sp.]